MAIVPVFLPRWAAKWDANLRIHRCRICKESYAGEMLDQILTIQNDTKNRIGNVVIMGIGEPLDNYENVVKFLRLVNHKDGINLGARHISVSTCGLVPEILRLAEKKYLLPCPFHFMLQMMKSEKKLCL